MAQRSPAEQLNAQDIQTIIDDMVHAQEGNLLSVAFWSNMLTNALAIALTIVTIWHPGYHLSPHLQALLDTVIPSVSVLAVAIANGFFVHNVHQTKQVQLMASVEGRRLALEQRKLDLAPYDIPVTPTTP